jgi:Anti-sigma-K factor rskA, C-terminal
MAISAALACMIVTVEFTSQLFRTNAHYRRRLSYLASRIPTMRAEIADTKRELAGLRKEAAELDRLDQILAAPDARIIRLVPPGHGGAPAGLVVISESNRSAMLQVSGLPPLPAGRSYELWWLFTKGAPSKGGLFNTGHGGEAVMAAELPTRAGSITTIVTAEGEVHAPILSGAVKLKGVATSADSTRSGRAR